MILPFYSSVPSRSSVEHFSFPPVLVKGVPLATEPDNSLIILPLMRILQRNLKRTTDTFLLISHTTNVLLFKFRCYIFIGVIRIKEIPGLVASGTHCSLVVRHISLIIYFIIYYCYYLRYYCTFRERRLSCANRCNGNITSLLL